MRGHLLVASKKLIRRDKEPAMVKKVVVRKVGFFRPAFIEVGDNNAGVKQTGM